MARMSRPLAGGPKALVFGAGLQTRVLLLLCVALAADRKAACVARACAEVVIGGDGGGEEEEGGCLCVVGCFIVVPLLVAPLQLVQGIMLLF